MKRSTKLILAGIATVFASLAAQAETATTDKFERDGVVYEYTSTEINGKTILRGTADGRSRFKLVVSNNRVRGTVDGKYVSFPNPNARKTEAAVIARAD